jgi:two-component system nitrogen regulation response regulator NtrX
VPSLRERTEDIPPLIDHFVAQFSAESGLRRRAFGTAALEAMRRHPWRGNVRELRNAIERLLIMVEGDEIRPEHLEGVLRKPGEASGGSAEAAGSLRGFKESAERTFIVQKLRESKWNISATAAAIGTPRSNLYKKLEQYGITQEKDG